MFFNRKPRMVGNITEKQFVRWCKRFERWLKKPADQATIDESVREFENIEVNFEHDAFIEQTRKDLETTVVYN